MQLPLACVYHQPKNALKLLELISIFYSFSILNSKNKAGTLCLNEITFYLSLDPWLGLPGRALVSMATYCHDIVHSSLFFCLLIYSIAKTFQFYFKIYLEFFHFSPPPLNDSLIRAHHSSAIFHQLLLLLEWNLTFGPTKGLVCRTWPCLSSKLTHLTLLLA